jgi:asparagine synthase (glutamine-hydrolysing)
MCGIAGWFEARPGSDAAPLASMLQQMTRRGPDDEGSTEIAPHTGGRLLLGSRRLAILDLSSAGHQPMKDPPTGNWLVYNGEIFNFRELRRELEARGCVFRSNGDTEVLLAGYRIWGEGVVSRLRGMFAFAIWDQARQTLLLVRDRLGIKPLYYFANSERFLFASELRALLASGLVRKDLDVTGLDSYLKFGAVQEPMTMVRDVRLLSAGHLLRWSGGTFRIERYWEFPAAADPVNGDADARRRGVCRMQEVLNDAVKMRLESDVPLGVFLSGGLDSTAVAAMAAQHGAAIQTFAVTFAEQKFAEGDKARRVAQLLGTEHHELILSQRDMLAALPEALAAMDQPTVDGINTYFVSRATKQAGVTVALSGLGGDEIFAGYRSFSLVPRMEWAERRVPAWTRALAGSLLDSSLFTSSRRHKLALWLRQQDGFPHPYYISRLLLTPEQVSRTFRAEGLLQIRFDAYAEEFAAQQRLLASHDPVNRVSCLELLVYLRNTLLRDADCMSMAHSLEVRVPLLDHVVIETALRMPGSWKLNGRQRKPLLVEALGRPLPPEILHQPKRGFEFPWGDWMRGQLRPAIEEKLAEPGAALAPVLNWNRVQESWQEFLAGRVHWSRVWLFYVLRNWCERNLTT